MVEYTKQTIYTGFYLTLVRYLMLMALIVVHLITIIPLLDGAWLVGYLILDAADAMLIAFLSSCCFFGMYRLERKTVLALGLPLTLITLVAYGHQIPYFGGLSAVEDTIMILFTINCFLTFISRNRLLRAFDRFIDDEERKLDRSGYNN
jgi:hypothetical protein